MPRRKLNRLGTDFIKEIKIIKLFVARHVYREVNALLQNKHNSCLVFNVGSFTVVTFESKIKNKVKIKKLKQDKEKSQIKAK